MTRSIRLLPILCVATALASCQSQPRSAAATASLPPPPPPEATHVLSMSLACRHAPPCPMGTAQDLATGEVMAIYDVDLAPLALEHLERSALRRSLDGETTQVEARIEARTDVPMAREALPVLVITGLPQQS